MNQARPTAFISHSHSDHVLAEELATRLCEKGVDAWFAPWEIKAGDSLVEKIFEQGLKDCSVFVILASPASVASPWVQEELSVAVINRIRKVTRIIPVLVQEDVELPVALRALVWLSMRDGLDRAVAEIVRAAFEIGDKKPEVQSPPKWVQLANVARHGLTQEATALAVGIAKETNLDRGVGRGYSGDRLSELTGLGPEAINDAVDELESRGMVTAYRAGGTTPYAFFMIEELYPLLYYFYQEVPGELNPDEDVKQAAAIIASMSEASGGDLTARLNWPPGRLNLAVAFLADHGIVKVVRTMGQAPFDFYKAYPTSATRRFVRQES